MKFSIVKKCIQVTSLIIALVMVVSPVFASDVLPTSDEFDWDAYWDWEDDLPPETIVNGVQPTNVEHMEELLVPSQTTVSRAALPSSVDLSTSIYFPVIRSQGSLASCVAFSAVYYQFTYEANKLNSLSSKVVANTYSPSWAYYGCLALSQDVGVSEDAVYSFLTDHGAMRWGEDIYVGGMFQSNIPWPTDETLMRNALNTRVSGVGEIKLTNQGTIITSNTDSDLNPIKTQLNAGKILRVSSHWLYSSNEDDETATNTIFYRFADSTANGGNFLGHSYVIVGYNDNITYDINENGVIEAGERGAFKAANSHGTSFGDSGFFWIMYDALNGVSSVSGNWENGMTTQRISAFSHQEQNKLNITNSENILNYIYVSNYNPVFIMEIELPPSELHRYNINLFNKTATQANELYYYTDYSDDFRFYTSSNSRKLLYDCNPLITNFNSCISSTYWGVSLGYAGNCTATNYYIALTDNLGNEMREMTRDSANTEFCRYKTSTTSFEYGDVDYDEELTSTDVNTIMSYVAGSVEFSNAQMIFADYNGDGNVNLVDASALLQYVQNN